MVLGQLIQMLTGHTLLSLFPLFLEGGRGWKRATIHPLRTILSLPRLATRAQYLPLFQQAQASFKHLQAMQVHSRWVCASTARSHLDKELKFTHRSSSFRIIPWLFTLRKLFGSSRATERQMQNHHITDCIIWSANNTEWIPATDCKADHL